MHIFFYSRMEYEIIVPEAGIIAAQAVTTEEAVKGARRGDGVGYKIFDVQKSIFGTLSKAAGDSRAEDRTGKLLRRVEITNVGIL